MNFVILYFLGVWTRCYLKFSKILLNYPNLWFFFHICTAKTNTKLEFLYIVIVVSELIHIKVRKCQVRSNNFLFWIKNRLKPPQSIVDAILYIVSVYSTVNSWFKEDIKLQVYLQRHFFGRQVFRFSKSMFLKSNNSQFKKKEFLKSRFVCTWNIYLHSTYSLHAE